LAHDLPETLDRLIPPARNYAHENTWHDGNAHSHLQATALGASMTIPVRDGQLVLGTWQQVFHIECGIKPRDRRIVVTVVGE
jgi:secondary thiamine-phosphate synthase enzyme